MLKSKTMKNCKSRDSMSLGSTIDFIVDFMPCSGFKVKTTVKPE